LLTLMILFLMGKKIYDARFGYLWSMVYLGTILPHLYFKSGIIDPYFNLFIFSGLYLFILFYWKKESWEGIDLSRSHYTYLFWAGFVVGLGILTKGQVAYLVVCLTFFVYWVYQRFRFYVNIPEFLFFTLATSLVSLTWYGFETWKNGPWFITEFNKYQFRLFSTPDAGHKGFPGYHFVVLLIGCFPASIFTIRTFFKMPTPNFPYQQNFRLWMKMLFWVVLILFSIVQSKIVHYSSLCYFPLSFLATLSIYEIINKRIQYSSWMKIGIGLIASLFIIATIAMPILSEHTDKIKPFIADPFARGNMDAQPEWNLFSYLAPICLLAVVLFHSYWQKRGALKRSFEALFYGTALFITITLIGFINQIESYSQNAAIEFMKQRVGEDCYVMPYSYRSYAHLFYTKKTGVDNSKSWDKHWLMHGDIDKDVYIVTKVHRLKSLEAQNIKNLSEVGRKNGFVFFKRSKSSPK
ncbi:MAG: glycosyl transferase, partial [Bacteroidota bacterium]